MDLFVTRVSDFQIPDIHLLSDHIIPHVLEEEKTIERRGDAYSMRGKTGYHSRDNLCGIGEPKVGSSCYDSRTCCK